MSIQEEEEPLKIGPARPVYSEARPTIEQAAEPEKTNGIICIFLLASILVQSIAEAIVIPSLCLAKISAFLGWVIASYSFGKALATQFFFKPLLKTSLTPRAALFFSLVFCVLGNALYCLVDNFPRPPWFLFLARFLVGFSGGSAELYRDYIARVPGLNGNDMSHLVPPVHGLGLFLGPVIAFLLSYIPTTPGARGLLVLDSETSPGVLVGGLALLNLVGLMILWRRFVRSPPDIEPELTRQQFEREPINLFPLWVAVVLFFVMGTVFSTFEAIAPLVTDMEYSWSVKQNSLLFLCVGIGTIISNLVASAFFPRFDDRNLAFFGYLVSMAAYLALVRWPFVALGEQSHLPLPQFLIGASLISVVYPFTFAFISLYVKCMHPMYHEEKAKWLLAGGTLSRMLGPIWAGYAFYYGYYLHGYGFVVLANVALLVVALFVLAAFYPKLRQHPIYTPRSAF